MYPPKFCSFRDATDAKFPAYLTPSTNLVDKIDLINAGIMKMNKEELRLRQGTGGDRVYTVKSGLTKTEDNYLPQMFKMHTYGIKALGKGKREHRWGVWFEKEDSRKLHLKHEKRAECIHRIQLYFIHNTDW